MAFAKWTPSLLATAWDLKVGASSGGAGFLATDPASVCVLASLPQVLRWGSETETKVPLAPR